MSQAEECQSQVTDTGAQPWKRGSISRSPEVWAMGGDFLSKGTAQKVEGSHFSEDSCQKPLSQALEASTAVVRHVHGTRPGHLCDEKGSSSPKPSLTMRKTSDKSQPRAILQNTRPVFLQPVMVIKTKRV